MISLPPEITQALEIMDGDQLTIEARSNQIVIFKDKKEGYSHLVKILPRIEEFWLAHAKDGANFKKAIKTSEQIRKMDREHTTVDPNYWYELDDLIGWVGAPTSKIFSEFQMEIKSYLEELNKELGCGFKLKV